MTLHELNCWSLKYQTLIVNLSHLVFPVKEQLLTKGRLLFSSGSICSGHQKLGTFEVLEVMKIYCYLFLAGKTLQTD